MAEYLVQSVQDSSNMAELMGGAKGHHQVRLGQSMPAPITTFSTVSHSRFIHFSAYQCKTSGPDEVLLVLKCFNLYINLFQKEAMATKKFFLFLLR